MAIPYEDILTGEQRNAYVLLVRTFMRYGLNESVGKTVYDAIVNGVTNTDQLIEIVRQSDAHKKRFAGMVGRKGAPIDEATYISIEQGYSYAMQQAGLPRGFYDSPSDFATWIREDKSPEEMAERIQSAGKVAHSIHPAQRTLLSNLWGIGQGELTAFILNSDKAAPILQRQVNAAGVGAYAANSGVLGTRGVEDFEYLVEAGVSAQQAAVGYSTVAEFTRQLGQVAGIYGEQYGVEDAERDVFLNDTEQRRGLASKERATFSGSSRGSTGRGNQGYSY